MLEKIKKIATKNNFNNLVLQLESIESTSEQFNIAFMGGFAVGKSSVISDMLGIDFLPIYLEESSAKITFIQHSENESAYKILNSGEIEKISFEELKNISLLNPENLSSIEYLSVMINEPKIEGLTIIDTPGIKGLIEISRDIAYDFIPKVDVSIYITGPKGFDNDDKNFLEYAKNNIKHFIPIVNKVDEIDLQERASVLEKYKNNWETLFDIEKNHPIFYYSCIEKNYYGNKGLEDYIFINLLNNRNKIKEDSKNLKINNIKNLLKNNLIIEKNLLEVGLVDKNLAKRIDSIRLDLANIDLDIKSQKTLLSSKIKGANSNFIEHNLIPDLDSFKFKSKSEIEKPDIDIKDLKVKFKERLILDLSSQIQKDYNNWEKFIGAEVIELAKKFDSDINNDLNSILQKQNITFGKNINLYNFDYNSLEIKTLLSSLEAKKEDLLINLEKIKEEKDILELSQEEIDSQKRFIEEILRDNDINLDEINNELSNLYRENPQMLTQFYEGSGSKGESWGRLLGNGVDWALIFLPGTQIKLLEPVMKGAKALGASKRIIDVLEKGQKVIKKTNKLKNIITGSVNKIGKKLGLNKNLPGIQTEASSKLSNIDMFLDNFSFEGWGGRLGKFIGHTIDPSYKNEIVDPEWKENQDELIKEKKQQLLHLLNSQKQNSNKINDFEYKKNKLEAELNKYEYNLELYIEKVNEIEKEKQDAITNQKNNESIYKLHLQNFVDKIVNEAKICFRECANISSQNIIENLHETLVQDLRNSKTSFLEQLSKTQSDLKLNDDSILNKINTLSNYIEELS